MSGQTVQPWSLTHEVKLIGVDHDNLLEHAFQLGRLWRSTFDVAYPVDMHDPSGPAPRDMSDETGEDSTYWMFVEALDAAGIDEGRRALEIGRAAHLVCARLAVEDDERSAEWAAHAAEIRDLLSEIIPAATIAAWGSEWEGKR